MSGERTFVASGGTGRDELAAMLNVKPATADARPRKVRLIGPLVFGTGVLNVWGARFARIYICRRGTSAGAEFTIKASGDEFVVRPGDTIIADGSEVQLQVTSNSIQAGTVRVAVSLHPEARYEEPAGNGAIMTSWQTNAVNSGTALATQLTALNALPVGTGGIPIDGARRVVAYVEALVGQTLTAGDLVWVFWNPFTQLWEQSDSASTVTVGVRSWASPAFELGAGIGRALAVGNNITSAGATINITSVAFE